MFVIHPPYLREKAGLDSFSVLAGDPSFRDFLCLYLAEGSKRTRHVGSVCNSDPAAGRLCDGWLHRLSERTPSYRVQYHADQDLAELVLGGGARRGA